MTTQTVPQPRPAPTYRCVNCRLDTAGRFTRHKHASGSGWSQHMNGVFWYCWRCLPFGQGAHEKGGQ